MIPKETIQLINDTARIEDVVGDYVTFRPRGSELWACCPFHNEKTPSFHVVPSKGRYYCFGCHKGGSAVDFLMEYEHLSYFDALRSLAKRYNIEIIEKEDTPETIAKRQRSESLYLVSEYAAGFFRDQLEEEEGRAVGLEYFHSRGLTDETIRNYGLGWAPSGRSTFSDAAQAAGYKSEFLTETGLCYQSEKDGTLKDRFCERVVFPIHSISGRVIAFGARTLKSKVEGEPYAKYVNSKESEIYVKKNSLYGIWFAKRAIAKEDRCYLVEGYLDVLSMHQLGILNVVASSGTALTEGQIALIKKFTDNVTILYDGDSAGIKAALRGIDMFLREGMNVKVVLIPDGDDPDSYSRKHTLEEVKSFLRESETDFLDFKASMALKDAEGNPLAKAEAINQIADTISLIPDAIKRSVYVEHLSEKLNVRRDVLESRVMSTRNKEMTVAVNRRKRMASAGVGSQAPDVTQVSAPAAGASPATVPDEKSGSASPSGLLEQYEENPIMAKAERDLLNFILTYGTETLQFTFDSEFYIEDEKERQTVFDFITQSLEEDGVTFANSLYRQIYDLYSEMYYQGMDQNMIVKRLLDGEDRKVAFAAERLSNFEVYELSVKDLRKSMMTTSSWLAKYVPKAILVFHNCRLECRLDELNTRLKQVQDTAGEDEINALLEEMMSLQKTIKTIKVRLGREKN